jgi:hypothetical protein
VLCLRSTRGPPGEGRTRESDEPLGANILKDRKENEMTTKQKCGFCGEAGQGICYECASLSMDWHNERLTILQRAVAGTELHRRIGNV